MDFSVTDWPAWWDVLMRCADLLETALLQCDHARIEGHGSGGGLYGYLLLGS